MTILLAIPILSFLVILQTAVASRISLLLGTVDLVLLVLVAWALQQRVDSAWQWALVGGFLAAIPTELSTGVVLISYLSVTGVALLIRRRVWQVPILSMLVATVIGTITIQLVAWVSLRISGVPLPILESVELVLLPCLLLNLLLSFPVFWLMSDLATWLYPQEIDI